MSALISLDKMGPLVQGVANVAEMHDLSPVTQGNGYWAQLRVLSCCLKKIKTKLAAMASERSSVFFAARVKKLQHGLSEYQRILVILKELLHMTLLFRKHHLRNTHHHHHHHHHPSSSSSSFSSRRGEEQAGEGHAGSRWSSGLFGQDLEHLALEPAEVSLDARRSLFMDSISMSSVQDAVRDLDLSVLYGEVHGYQYPARLKHFLRVILVAAAGYSRSFEEHSEESIYRQLAAAYIHGVKFLMKPVKRSERLAQQFRHGDIKFVKNF